MPKSRINFRNDVHKNLMSHFLDDDLVFNVMKPYWNLTEFRAALGHKANHNFDSSAHFATGFNPRFGFCVVVVADKRIKTGDEVFVDYSYDSENSTVPEWYANLYSETTGSAWTGATMQE